MILTCPRCATRYQTDPALFPSDGRAVRCAKCGFVWHQSPPEPDTAAPGVDGAGAPENANLSESAAMAAAGPAEPHDRPRGRRLDAAALVLGWAALALIVIGTGAAAIHYRDDIAALWPQSAPLFAAVGLPIHASGLAFARVAYHREVENGEAVLAVSGSLVNVSGHEVVVPTVRVSLIDAAKHELCHWSFAPNIRMLAPGEAESFRTRLPNPPDGARDIELHFAG